MSHSINMSRISNQNNLSGGHERCFVELIFFYNSNWRTELQILAWLLHPFSSFCWFCWLHHHLWCCVKVQKEILINIKWECITGYEGWLDTDKNVFLWKRICALCSHTTNSPRLFASPSRSRNVLVSTSGWQHGFDKNNYIVNLDYTLD